MAGRGRPKGSKNKSTDEYIRSTKVLLRDGNRKPLEVVLHSMNVAFEKAERIATRDRNRALRSDDPEVREGADLIVPDYEVAVDYATRAMPFLHAKLANITVTEDEKTAEEVEASFNAIVSKLDAIAAKKAVTFIPPGDPKVIDLSRRREDDK